MQSKNLVWPVAALAVACSKSPIPSTQSPAASVSAPKASTESVPVVLNAPFEGEIIVAVKSEPARKLPASITYDVKGNRVRYEPAGAPVRILADVDLQKVYAIDDARKSFDALEVGTPGMKPMPPPKVHKTGKNDKIAGLDCENWTIDDGSKKVDVCASKGIPYFDLASDAKPGSMETPWAVALTTERAFPLRVVVHDKSGKEEYRAEATTAVRKKFDDSVLRLPIEYRRADLAKEVKTASLP